LRLRNFVISIVVIIHGERVVRFYHDKDIKTKWEWVKGIYDGMVDVESLIRTLGIAARHPCGFESH
jgi:hypothetical protein